MGALRLVHQRGPWRSPDSENASRVRSGSPAHSQTSLGRSPPYGHLWLCPWLLVGVYPRLGPWDVYTPGTCWVSGPERLSSTLVLAWIPGLGDQQGTWQKKSPALRNFTILAVQQSGTVGAGWGVRSALLSGALQNGCSWKTNKPVACPTSSPQVNLYGGFGISTGGVQGGIRYRKEVDCIIFIV